MRSAYPRRSSQARTCSDSVGTFNTNTEALLLSSCSCSCSCSFSKFLFLLLLLLFFLFLFFLFLFFFFFFFFFFFPVSVCSHESSAAICQGSLRQIQKDSIACVFAGTAMPAVKSGSSAPTSSSLLRCGYSRRKERCYRKEL